ncbi:uncharacterized protein [Kogia breviceps]|uniref:uncharacterized protein n=1 Tax=Kogia breviceps TaxID=27615 RepID=UPI0034D1D499
MALTVRPRPRRGNRLPFPGCAAPSSPRPRRRQAEARPAVLKRLLVPQTTGPATARGSVLLLSSAAGAERPGATEDARFLVGLRLRRQRAGSHPLNVGATVSRSPRLRGRLLSDPQRQCLGTESALFLGHLGEPGMPLLSLLPDSSFSRNACQGSVVPALHARPITDPSLRARVPFIHLSPPPMGGNTSPGLLTAPLPADGTRRTAGGGGGRGERVCALSGTQPSLRATGLGTARRFSLAPRGPPRPSAVSLLTFPPKKDEDSEGSPRPTTDTPVDRLTGSPPPRPPGPRSSSLFRAEAASQGQRSNAGRTG